MQFGEQIRLLRESQGLLQRQLAASLQIDTPMFSKIERGERKAKREQVELLAELLHADKIQFISLWLADQVFDLIRDEPQAKEVIDLVKKELKKYEH
ncbi:MAG: helix-turn-helix transcriptional regulator [Cytophagales bacterium]|jgi:transcriptional regulator with XRE-family HTH domain|nr:helix-turn-helix transcriptional regulator [Cytophagales bacterium]MCA6390641.1 helix-turn-helix transcriptional regulator [Cytophagales bacterium]MCA6403303.1 helix-turn-helix transcriptional regulator [Cytophagales bacterium]MCA6410437.1 helix-turn-helix transcriptional regulator [Cytophagales bacterium]MCA6411236.1 helix-turn-helix transcriptional regulator [Cytophagales bacterium]